MEKDLRLVRFPDDGEMITILPSYGGSLENEPKIFKGKNCKSARFSIKRNDLEYARIVSKRYNGDKTLVYFDNMIQDELLFINSVIAIRDHLQQRGITLDIVYKQDDWWLEELLGCFVNHEFKMDSSGLKHCIINSYENS